MRISHPGAPRSRAGTLLVSTAATLLGVLLIVFHGILLWQRVLDLSLLRPVPAIRWLATVALLFGLVRLHRRGVSLIRGRSALVFWLLVLLLHVCFWGPLAGPADTFEGIPGTGWLLALPAFTIVLGLGLTPIRRVLARALRGFELRDLPRVAPFITSQSYCLRIGFLPTIARRPPPLPSI